MVLECIECTEVKSYKNIQSMTPVLPSDTSNGDPTMVWPLSWIWTAEIILKKLTQCCPQLKRGKELIAWRPSFIIIANH